MFNMAGTTPNSGVPILSSTWEWFTIGLTTLRIRINGNIVPKL